jgi:Nicotianamine synthase protein.
MEAKSTGSIIDAGDASSVRKVESFIAFIRELNDLLQREVDLSPSNRSVAEMIGRLSHLLRLSYLPEEVQAVLNDEYIRRNQLQLQNKLSEAEFLAELTDAHLMCEATGTVMDIIIRLSNWQVYKALVSQELAMLRQFNRLGDSIEKLPIIFVGSGPMPISPILVHLFGDVEVICLEMNSSAYETSRTLLAHLGLEKRLSVVLTNGSDFDYSAYSCIFMASLVRNKQEVLEQISRTSQHPLVAVRTAEGMKQMMYEAIDESLLEQQRWRIVGRTHPDEGLVINSTLFLDRE